MRITIFFLVAAVLCGGSMAFTGSEPVFAQGGSVVEKIDKAMPDKAPATPKAKRKILIFSKTAGFRHGSIATGIRALTAMGEKTGAFLVLSTEDESYFEPGKLKGFDAVLMLNTTGE